MTDTTKAFVEAFNRIAIEVHHNARSKGFWDASDELQTLADINGLGEEMHKMRNSQLRDLIYSEFGEMCEGERRDLPSDKIPGFTNAEEEMADAVIRIMDMAYGRGLRIAEAVAEKMAYNATRPAMHGGKSF